MTAMESSEDEKRRFEIECEFVQSLANPNYVNFLAQRGYFKEDYFVNYLKYLLYWKQPDYARALKYPQSLHILEALQNAQYRDAMAAGPNAKFVEDQLMLQWQFYLRKRQRLYDDPDDEVEDAKPDTSGSKHVVASAYVDAEEATPKALKKKDKEKKKSEHKKKSKHSDKSDKPRKDKQKEKVKEKDEKTEKEPTFAATEPV